jgi:O-succinylbenzoate synthase
MRETEVVPTLLPPPHAVHTYAIAMRTRFRGITTRQGMLWRGPAGWAEWSPFLDYSGPE